MRKIAAVVLLSFFGATLAAQTSIFVWPGTNNFPGTISVGTLTVTGNAAVTGTTTSTGQFLAGSGTLATPSYSFTAQADLGIYRPSANNIYFTQQSTIEGSVAGGLGFETLSNRGYNWSSSNVDPTPGTVDTQLLRVSAGVVGVTTAYSAPNYRGSGTGTSVANVGANSCGTTTATIAGNQVSGVITVGATAGTQCRVTFTTAAPVARDCTVTDSTTTIATRATVVDVSNTDFLGAFVAGDKVTFICMTR